MRHAKRINHLGRTDAHRKAMLSNMATSLIMHKRINTTLAKAKELRKYVEPLVTRCKNDTTHSRRIVFSQLHNKYAVTELFREIAPKVATRPGGYTRILKTGFRKGDNAEMCMMEFVDYNENYTVESGAKKKSTRTRRSSKKSAQAPAEPVAEAAAETVNEAPAAE
ncbi:MAG: 50S ribosomal protein L17 [Bacteroidales bacterium]|nr:50S ribosomal protein L17 [Bacteroidales bacterium]MBO7648182.1 50S ribosomal protein L17 [Bacteroidales bacterium]MCR4858291.1 50S ribosomal protein L17 [Bacteroidales bacterium]